MTQSTTVPAFKPDDPLSDLNKWFQLHCDGDWEHQSGITLETLDNPGWSISVDIGGIPHLTMEFPEIHEEENAGPRWLHITKQDNILTGACGPEWLHDMLSIIVDWLLKEAG